MHNAWLLDELVHLMNELNLGGSIGNMHESIVSYSEPMSSEGVFDIQEENKTPAGVEDDSCLMSSN
jgi:hypothetical protein